MDYKEIILKTLYKVQNTIKTRYLKGNHIETENGKRTYKKTRALFGRPRKKNIYLRKLMLVRGGEHFCW